MLASLFSNLLIDKSFGFTKKFILQLSLSISVQESHLKIELKKPEVGYEEIAGRPNVYF